MATTNSVNTLETTVTLPSPLPYAPSWFDHLKNWVERLPIAWWLFYVLVAVALVAIEFALQTQAGLQNLTLQRPFLFWFAGGIALVPAMLHYLDRAAGEAMEALRPTLNVADTEYAVLCYRLTHLPARPTLVWGIACASVSFLAFSLTADVFASYGTFETQWLEILHLAFFAVTWFIYGTLIYHSIHQLRTISQIYADNITINLFDLDPLYTFSGVTARTAIGLVIINLAWNTAPETNTNAFGIATGLAFAAFAFIVFALPLWGIHKRLDAEKSRLYGNAGKRLQTQLAELHASLDEGSLERLARIKDAVNALETERTLLAKIPTWPWSADTLRTVLTAILFPTVVFLIQMLLKQFLP